MSSKETNSRSRNCMASWIMSQKVVVFQEQIRNSITPSLVTRTYVEAFKPSDSCSRLAIPLLNSEALPSQDFILKSHGYQSRTLRVNNFKCRMLLTDLVSFRLRVAVASLSVMSGFRWLNQSSFKNAGTPAPAPIS
jgi:hypothetical protein